MPWSAQRSGWSARPLTLTVLLFGLWLVGMGEAALVKRFDFSCDSSGATHPDSEAPSFSAVLSEVVPGTAYTVPGTGKY